MSVKDQDYRSATVKDKVSNTISVIGIPKTATMEQVIIKEKKTLCVNYQTVLLVFIDRHGTLNSLSSIFCVFSDSRGLRDP